MGQTKNKLYALFLRNPTVDNKEKCVAYRNKFKSLRKLVAVIKLSGGWGWDGSTPSSFFNPPSLFSKITLGVRLNPPEQRSIAQCILLSACTKRFPTRVSFRMIQSSEAMTALWIIYFSRCRTCRYSIFVHLCHIHRYVYASVLWVTRDQKLKRRVAQNKWDLLLKLCMGYLLTIKINYNGIVVSIYVFSMVKPVQYL